MFLKLWKKLGSRISNLKQKICCQVFLFNEIDIDKFTPSSNKKRKIEDDNLMEGGKREVDHE